jgi:hypothetical protein
MVKKTSSIWSGYPSLSIDGLGSNPHELRPDLHPTPISGIPEGVIVPQRQSAEVNHENQA